MRLCLKWLSNSQVKALIHSQVLHKVPSIGTSIHSVLCMDCCCKASCELVNKQVPRHMTVCKELLKNLRDIWFWHSLCGDEKHESIFIILIREFNGFVPAWFQNLLNKTSLNRSHVVCLVNLSQMAMLWMLTFMIYIYICSGIYMILWKLTTWHCLIKICIHTPWQCSRIHC